MTKKKQSKKPTVKELYAEIQYLHHNLGIAMHSIDMVAKFINKYIEFNNDNKKFQEWIEENVLAEKDRNKD